MNNNNTVEGFSYNLKLQNNNLKIISNDRFCFFIIDLDDMDMESFLLESPFYEDEDTKDIIINDVKENNYIFSQTEYNISIEFVIVRQKKIIVTVCKEDFEYDFSIMNEKKIKKHNLRLQQKYYKYKYNELEKQIQLNKKNRIGYFFRIIGVDETKSAHISDIFTEKGLIIHNDELTGIRSSNINFYNCRKRKHNTYTQTVIFCWKKNENMIPSCSRKSCFYCYFDDFEKIKKGYYINLKSARSKKFTKQRIYVVYEVN